MARIKKEDVFYTQLKELAAKIEEASAVYERIVTDFPESSSSIPQMKVYEDECDEKVGAIMNGLYKAFITPIDREDISDLAMGLDDIMDGMNGVSRRLDLFNVGGTREEAVQMAELTTRCVREVRETVDRLPNYKHDETVLEHAKTVTKIEDQGDIVYENALRRLFADEENGRTTAAWLRLFDRMEGVLDACDRAAGVIRAVVLKSA